jgi:hypothetical protein
VSAGRAVLGDPFLKQNSTSQLALLSVDVYQTGIQNIKLAITEAQKRGEQITFHSDLFIKMCLGYKPNQ